MEKSDILNLISTFSCIVSSKNPKKTPRNYYKITLYASLISDTKQVSVCLGEGGVDGCTGCYTKKSKPKLNPNFQTT